jgi:hypothetical protein
VLGLPTTATNADIVARGQELSVGSEQHEQMQIQQAIEALITHPMTRLEHELFEVPDAQYEEQSLERFLRVFNRNPLRLPGASAPTLEPAQIEALIQLLLDRLLTISQTDPEAALYEPPFTLHLNPPIGVRDVIF